MTLVDWIGIIGAVVAVGALGLSILNYGRDRAHVSVEVERGHLSSGSGQWEGPYVFVKAVNDGRRTVQLHSGGVLLPGRDVRLQIMPGPPGHPTGLPKTLNEAGQTQLWTLVDSLVEELVNQGGALPTHGYFDDSSGRRWRGKVPEGIRDELRAALNQQAVTGQD